MMQLLAYALPRAFETEELTRLLMRLTPTQRRVLRAYVDCVEVNKRLITDWLADPICPVSEREWYRKGDTAHYKNSADFQAVLTEYTRAALRGAAEEELKGLTASLRKLRLGAPRAADRLVHEVDHGESSRDRIKASAEVLDRAGVETAAKGETTVELGARFEEALRRAYGGEAQDGQDEQG